MNDEAEVFNMIARKHNELVDLLIVAVKMTEYIPEEERIKMMEQCKLPEPYASSVTAYYSGDK